MLTLEGLKQDRALINSIDWDMTPEMAVRLYLEWGNVWTPGEGRRYTVKSKSDYSVYFVVNCWERPYYIYSYRLSIILHQTCPKNDGEGNNDSQPEGRGWEDNDSH